MSRIWWADDITTADVIKKWYIYIWDPIDFEHNIWHRNDIGSGKSFLSAGAKL